MEWGNFVYIDNDYNNSSNFMKDEYDEQIMNNNNVMDHYDYYKLNNKNYTEYINKLDEIESLYENGDYQYYHYSIFERNEFMFMQIIYACIYNSWIFKRLSCIFGKKTRVY